MRSFSELVSISLCVKVLQMQLLRQERDEEVIGTQRAAKTVLQGPARLCRSSSAGPCCRWGCALRALEVTPVPKCCSQPGDRSRESSSSLGLICEHLCPSALTHVCAHMWCERVRGRVIPFNEWQTVYLDNLHG